MSERKRKMQEYKEQQKAEAAPKKRKAGTPTKADVYMDVGLAVFCLFSVILSPLSLWFAATAYMKYKLYKKAKA